MGRSQWGDAGGDHPTDFYYNPSWDIPGGSGDSFKLLTKEEWQQVLQDRKSCRNARRRKLHQEKIEWVDRFIADGSINRLVNMKDKPVWLRKILVAKGFLPKSKQGGGL